MTANFERTILTVAIRLGFDFYVSNNSKVLMKTYTNCKFIQPEMLNNTCNSDTVYSELKLRKP